MAVRGHILLVDDDVDLREAVALLLMANGHTVVEAADGQLALDALASTGRFHLVVLDLMMPVMMAPPSSSTRRAVRTPGCRW